MCVTVYVCVTNLLQFLGLVLLSDLPGTCRGSLLLLKLYLYVAQQWGGRLQAVQWLQTQHHHAQHVPQTWSHACVYYNEQWEHRYRSCVLLVCLCCVGSLRAFMRVCERFKRRSLTSWISKFWRSSFSGFPSGKLGYFSGCRLDK